jgi:tRNA A-37 threonylcarbamoyl transferase component Bud32
LFREERYGDCLKNTGALHSMKAECDDTGNVLSIEPGRRASMDDLTGKTLGNYRIVERVGRGGMAMVYKAYQPALERYVAIKVIHKHLAADDEQFLKRFQREAKAVASLRHPNIVQVFDFGTENDVTYMVMEYLKGTTLKAALNALAQRDETMRLDEVLHIFQALASALGHAHQQGMVHRDIKPANVMLTTKDDVVLTDFGIAKIVGGTQVTATGVVTGTPAYMSPEQGRGERGDERSDIYALGVMLYEMVTGRVPFDADTPLAVIMKHISAPLPLPRQLNPIIPEAVERVILKALAKDPNDRYQTVAEMTNALEAAIAGQVAPDGERLPELAKAFPIPTSRAVPWAVIGLVLVGTALVAMVWAVVGAGGIALLARQPTASTLLAPTTTATLTRIGPTPAPLSTFGPSSATLMYTSSGERSEGFYAVAGGTSCCGCRVRNYGNLPADFPESDVSSVTFYLTASREDSYYTRVQAGPSMLKLILGDRETTATSEQVPSGREVPVKASWLITFNFDPPVRAVPGMGWELLDGDDNIYSNVWPHCSDVDETGLQGVHEILDCQYAAVTDVWYSVQLDLVAP